MKLTNKEIFDQMMDNKTIRLRGFDTISALSGIPKDEVKSLWWAKYKTFKRIPRTEFGLRPRPDLVEGNGRMLYEVKCDGYLVFHITETAVLIIPNGFITDLGSVPEFLLWVVNKDDKHMLMAYLFHDMSVDYDFTSRILTDAWLLEIGKEMGASWLKRNIVHTPVRMKSWVRCLTSLVLPPREKPAYAKRNYRLIKEATKEYMHRHNLGNNYKFIIQSI